MKKKKTGNRPSATMKGRSSKIRSKTTPVQQRHNVSLASKKISARRAMRDRTVDVDTLTLKQIRVDLSPRAIQFTLQHNLAHLYGFRAGRALGATERDDEASFDAAWKVSRVWRRFTRLLKDNRVKGHTYEGPVRKAFSNIAQICKTKSAISQRGYDSVDVADVNGKFVVFSDHHRCIDSNRQNFFGKNSALYVDALKAYKDEGYTVVENGDVEELIVRRYSPDEYKGWLRKTMAELNERRLELRLEQLNRILHAPENQDLYATLAELADAGQYLRVNGNHDIEMASNAFFAALRAKIPSLEKPSDFLLLTNGGGGDVHTLITHGHHFDHFSNPDHSPFLGELISETMSWAYQGADRNWTWDAPGGNTKQWVEGGRPFNNVLTQEDSLALNISDVFTEGKPHTDEWLLEALSGKNIAWEYFMSSQPGEAWRNEVLEGKAFFKFRHMDEVNIMKGWNKIFPQQSTRPQLLLGHSHEVRLNARIPGTNARYPWLINSGAAGRFENLVWGVELNAGVAQIVAWSRPGNRPTEQAQRYVYTVESAGLRGARTDF